MALNDLETLPHVQPAMRDTQGSSRIFQAMSLGVSVAGDNLCLQSINWVERMLTISLFSQNVVFLKSNLIGQLELFLHPMI